MSAWLFLMGAILLEIGATTALKLSNGFEKIGWGMTSIALYSACFWVFAPALKVIPVGVAYAIWAGLGVVGAAVIGWFAFSERLGMVQLLCIALIVAGAVGLRLTTDAG